MSRKSVFSPKLYSGRVLEVLYPFTVTTLVKQPDVRHRVHGRESLCVRAPVRAWDRASASA